MYFRGPAERTKLEKEAEKDKSSSGLPKVSHTQEYAHLRSN